MSQSKSKRKLWNIVVVTTERASDSRGYRRRYPRTRNYFVIRALNYLFEEFGMPEFCVEEEKTGRTRRFVAPD